MKKLVAIAALFLFFGLGVSYGAESEKPKQEVTPKEFISEDMPEDVMILLWTITQADMVGERFLSSGMNAGMNDYLVREFVTNYGKVRLLAVFKCSRDEKGNLMPWTCEGYQAALVFEDLKVSWFKSLDAKKAFELVVRDGATK